MTWYKELIYRECQTRRKHGLEGLTAYPEIKTMQCEFHYDELQGSPLSLVYFRFQHVASQIFRHHNIKEEDHGFSQCHYKCAQGFQNLKTLRKFQDAEICNFGVFQAGDEEILTYEVLFLWQGLSMKCCHASLEKSSNSILFSISFQIYLKGCYL